MNLSNFTNISHNLTKEKIKKDYPRYIYLLFHIFSIYLVLPIIDLPFLGLSISAPILFIIAVPLFLNPGSPWFKKYQLSIFLGLSIYTGIFLSTIINGITSFGVDIDQQGIEFLLRYLYWIIAFIITVYFTSQEGMLKKTASILGICIFILALFRWGEVIFLGNYVGIKGTRLQKKSQNCST